MKKTANKRRKEERKKERKRKRKSKNLQQSKKFAFLRLFRPKITYELLTPGKEYTTTPPSGPSV